MLQVNPNLFHNSSCHTLQRLGITAFSPKHFAVPSSIIEQYIPLVESAQLPMEKDSISGLMLKS